MDTNNDVNLQTRDDRHRKIGWKGWLSEHLKEIIIGLVTLGVGSYIIPTIFNTLENIQKELEIKVDLIEQMTESAIEPIGIVQVLEQNRSDSYPRILLSEPSNSVITKERLELIQEARLIESQLRSYFPYDNSSVARDWNNVAAPAYNFVSLYSVDDPADRISVTRDIYRFFVEDTTIIVILSNGTANKTDVLIDYLNFNMTSPEDNNKLEEFKEKLFGENLTVIEDLSKRTELYNSTNPKDREKYRVAYNTVHDLIKEKFDRLTETILKTRIPGYETPFSVFYG